MSGQSLGLIETVGLAAAIEAADAAVKSANVNLTGYELTKGGGMITVKLVGEIGAINAAVSAGVAAAQRIGRVYAYKVIARTAQGLAPIINTNEAKPEAQPATDAPAQSPDTTAKSDDAENEVKENTTDNPQASEPNNNTDSATNTAPENTEPATDSKPRSRTRRPPARS